MWPLVFQRHVVLQSIKNFLIDMCIDPFCGVALRHNTVGAVFIKSLLVLTFLKAVLCIKNDDLSRFVKAEYNNAGIL